LYDALDFSTDHDGGGDQTRESLSRIASPSAALTGLDNVRFAHQVRRARQVPIPTEKRPVGCASPARVFFGGCRRRRPFHGATDQMQTRNSTPGQTKRMTNVIPKVMAIAILAINGRRGVGDCVGPSRRRDGRTCTRRSSRVIARTAASQTQNNPTL
jgi:hypothetical protein